MSSYPRYYGQFKAQVTTIYALYVNFMNFVDSVFPSCRITTTCLLKWFACPCAAGWLWHCFCLWSRSCKRSRCVSSLFCLCFAEWVRHACACARRLVDWHVVLRCNDQRCTCSVLLVTWRPFDEGTDNRWSNLLTWAADNDVYVSEKLVLGAFAHAGLRHKLRGVGAARHIAPGELLIRVTRT